jgi:hypothetical protein
MQLQNYSNHRRLIPLYHYATLGVILLIIVLSSYKLFKAVTHHQFYYIAVLLVLISFVLLMLFWYCRLFALKAQDRAIRVEENFRHYLLTGQPLPSNLNIYQIVALRFADDDEFPALAQRSVNENMKSNEIKKAIRNWRSDSHRV